MLAAIFAHRPLAGTRLFVVQVDHRIYELDGARKEVGRVPGRGVRSSFGSDIPVRPEGRTGSDSAAFVGLG